MKTCSHCQRDLPAERFSWADKAKTYRRGDCLSCTAAKAKARRAADPDKYQRQQREITYRNKYGAELSDVEALLEAQGHVCPICAEPVVLGDHLDHDHATGALRGVLHRACNWLLGNAEDDPVRLLRAADYLMEKTPCASGS